MEKENKKETGKKGNRLVNIVAGAVLGVAAVLVSGCDYMAVYTNDPFYSGPYYADPFYSYPYYGYPRYYSVPKHKHVHPKITPRPDYNKPPKIRPSPQPRPPTIRPSPSPRPNMPRQGSPQRNKR